MVLMVLGYSHSCFSLLLHVWHNMLMFTLWEVWWNEAGIRTEQSIHYKVQHTHFTYVLYMITS